MEYVNLGRTGLRVSRICLGMMSFGPSEERPWALDEQHAAYRRRTSRSPGSCTSPA
jgi:aryl-alcohol dehydrogenase-like predicted oxidoreductase